MVLNHPFLGTQQSNFDLPSVIEANNLEELRAQITQPFEVTRMVVIPTSVVTGFEPDTYSRLSDLIPLFDWAAGPPDGDGIPQFRYATLHGK